MTDDIQTVREALRVDIFNRAEIEERRAAREALDRIEAVVTAAREIDAYVHRKFDDSHPWKNVNVGLDALHAALAALDPTEAPADELQDEYERTFGRRGTTP